MRVLLVTALLCFVSACAPKPAFAKARPAVITCDQRGCSDWNAPRQRQTVTVSRKRHHIRTQRRQRVAIVRRQDNSLRRSSRGLVAPLKAKADAIVAACPGAYVMSAVRHTRVRGSGRLSLHASGRAVDMAGNAACIYRELAGWPGGVSTDYGRVRHVHFSYSPNGREWGARFAHWRPTKRTRYAAAVHYTSAARRR